MSVLNSLLFSLLSKCFLIEVKPSSYDGMLGYRPTISAVHTIAFFGQLAGFLRFLRKEFVSLIKNVRELSSLTFLL